MPVYEMKTLEAQLDETLLTDRLIALLSAGFGLLATLLASIGLYGVMAFVVARRRKELGIRLALGAQPAVRDLAGDEGGAAAAGDRPRGRHSRRDRARPLRRRRSSTASSRTIRGSRCATVVLLAVVSAAAGLIPAHRASRIDPILALRIRVTLPASGVRFWPAGLAGLLRRHSMQGVCEQAFLPQLVSHRTRDDDHALLSFPRDRNTTVTAPRRRHL